MNNYNVILSLGSRTSGDMKIIFQEKNTGNICLFDGIGESEECDNDLLDSYYEDEDNIHDEDFYNKKILCESKEVNKKLITKNFYTINGYVYNNIVKYANNLFKKMKLEYCIFYDKRYMYIVIIMKNINSIPKKILKDLININILDDGDICKINNITKHYEENNEDNNLENNEEKSVKKTKKITKENNEDNNLENNEDDNKEKSVKNTKKITKKNNKENDDNEEIN